MKTIYLMTRLAWKVFISSKPCRLIVILLQGFVQHMFDKLLFLLTPLKIAISYKVKKNSTKWNSRAERGCRTATSSMRASAHPPENFPIIQKSRSLICDLSVFGHSFVILYKKSAPAANLYPAPAFYSRPLMQP